MFFCFFVFAKRNPYQRIISRQKTRRLGSFNKSRMINENKKLQEAIVDRKIPVLFFSAASSYQLPVMVRGF